MSERYEDGRRRFLQGLLRGAALGALIGGAGLLAYKPGQNCTNAGICRGCGALTDCALPQALSFKQARARGR